MELLEPYIRSGLGIAIKADNGKYLTREGPVGLVFKKSVKDPYTVFDIEKVDDNTISLKNRSNGYYVSRTDLDLTKVEGVQEIGAQEFLHAVATIIIGEKFSLDLHTLVRSKSVRHT